MAYEPASALDRFVAPRLRLWMLIGLVASILLIMVVIVCCSIRLRIPRTKRQIDLIAARRKMRKNKQHAKKSGHDNGYGGPDQHEETHRGQTIVLNNLGGKGADRGHKIPNAQQPLVSKSLPV